MGGRELRSRVVVVVAASDDDGSGGGRLGGCEDHGEDAIFIAVFLQR